MQPTEEPTEQPTAHCAEHEGAQASGTCARCGSFVCPLCLDPSSAFDALCAACREREGALLMAWERPGDGWPKRWARTCRDMIVSPSAAFERTRPGAFGAPIAFNATTAVVVGVAATLILLCLLGGMFVLGGFPGGLDALGGAEADDAGIVVGVLAAFFVLYPLGFVASALLAHALLAGLFHGAAKALGGAGAFSTSAWAVGYLAVGQLAMLPLSVLSYVPVLGPLIALAGYVAIGAWIAVHLTTVARHHHGLEGARAALAGWAPFLVAIGLSFVGCALVVVLALMDLS